MRSTERWRPLVLRASFTISFLYWQGMEPECLEITIHTLTLFAHTHTHSLSMHTHKHTLNLFSLTHTLSLWLLQTHWKLEVHARPVYNILEYSLRFYAPSSQLQSVLPNLKLGPFPIACLVINAIKKFHFSPVYTELSIIAFQLP
jgi:hypothetical protein